MKRILLIGRNGQVGWELERTLAPLAEIVPCDRARLDLTDSGQIGALIRETEPDAIVNAAAYTAVDQAEGEPDLAMAINGTAPGVLAEEAKRTGALLVHYSTDYVFDGKKNGAYTEEDTPDPVNVYGRTKLAGERAILASGCRYLIFRTSWVYGARGRNFLRTILRLAKEREELRVVDDQIGAPTWSRMIAEATALILAGRPSTEGIFHMACDGATSWHGFAQAILAATQDTRARTPSLMPIATSQYPLPAQRPANSQLDCTRLRQAAGITMPHWQNALALCLDGA